MPELQKLKEALKRLNGANLIIENKKGEILVGRATYGKKQFILPGGAIERGEKPVHAAVSEAEEETGIIVQEKNTKLLGVYLQKISGVESATGFVFLYRTKIYKGELKETDELSELQFMSIEEIIDRYISKEFSLGYVRMIIHHCLIKENLLHFGFEKRLGDAALYQHKGSMVSI
jgi:8-oxo-dGTP pyrophosphatase MutT (NUDIX family)